MLLGLILWGLGVFTDDDDMNDDYDRTITTEPEVSYVVPQVQPVAAVSVRELQFAARD